MKTPDALVVDDEQFHCRCVDDGPEFQPYVDVRLDTIPPCEGDPDFSEDPAVLRKVAAWLVKAAEWLDRRQRG